MWKMSSTQQFYGPKIGEGEGGGGGGVKNYFSAGFLFEIKIHNMFLGHICNDSST